MSLHHVQMAAPPGSEPAVRAWFTALGFVEIPKPTLLAVRGGCWFRLGEGPDGAELHVGIEVDFTPARKAHPALHADVDRMAELVRKAGGELRWADPAEWAGSHLAGLRRFHTYDPLGNRLEFVGR